jgi:hypothetical protein
MSDQQEEKDYDMDGYVAKYGQPDQSKGQHLTDEFKLPNHITFSDESKYSTKETPGGQWKDEDGKWHYYASDYVEKRQGSDRLKEYFKKHEPDSVLHLPSEDEDAAMQESFRGKK